MIYLYHIERCGGTSMTKMFLAAENPNYEESYHTMTIANRAKVKLNGKVFVGWNKRVLETGNYYYGFSHIPSHKINIPNGFKFTIFRDPIDRFISYYKIIMEIKKENLPYIQWIDKGDKLVRKIKLMKYEYKAPTDFRGFLDYIPQEVISEQLYFFSKRYNIYEALENVSKLDHYMFLDDFEKGVRGLERKLSIELPILKNNQSTYKFKPTKDELEYLKSKIEPSIKFYKLLKNL